ncbi:MAG: hypothetical protein RPU37_00570 [Candidatus Sedimenticola sp. (ex Thyasira tokunagai)]
MKTEEEKNAAEIRRSLRNLRILKFMVFFPFIMTMLVGVALFNIEKEWVSTVKPIFMLFFIWAFVGGLFGGARIRNYECPRCQRPFHHGQRATWFGILPVWNDFARTCMHCGLNQNGSNI